MYNIYINEIRLTVTENVPNSPENYNLLEEKDFDILDFYKKLNEGLLVSDQLIIVPNTAAWLEKQQSKLQSIDAAGGLVKNADGAYLFIFRRGKWDLPKGKIDEGERVEHAAVREVEEECGVKVAELGDLITSTYHIYPYQDGLAFKKTYWFSMKVAGVPSLLPQTEEDITEAAWLKPNELEKVKANTFPLILEILERVGI